jgi:IS30 family transposase
MPALPLVEPSLPSRFLTIVDREAIAVGIAQRLSIRQIARDIGRAPSTVKREIGRNLRHQSYRSRAELAGSKRGPTPAKIGYAPHLAQARAEAGRARPKVAKLAGNARLRAVVQDQLEKKHSPEQISNRLRVDFPDDAEMRVCPEVIYQSLYVQGRGALRRDLHKCLRSGRALRRPHRKPDQRRGRIVDMVMISERPAEVDDRAVPGHWEGDLIVGAFSKSAIGTLVERTTRFTMLLHLPHDHTAAAVQDAMLEAMSRLPATLRKTLTWDQGKEMANHAAIAAATDLAIFFCDPHSPWQRPTNENTNGLLRQYFPKGTDLSPYPAGYLDHVAAELNNRPRKTLGWQTPAEQLDQLLSSPSDPSPVASIG